MSSTSTAELLNFELDASVIHHIIHSQAGSISKALIELVMNSIDAGTDRIDLVVSKAGFSIEDSGRGFRSRTEVIEWFGRFGTPHVEGDADFGRFRLGRGQIMAFAPTVWTSKDFRMTVDVAVDGYKYRLEHLDGSQPEARVEGCRIEGAWYETLEPEEARALVVDLVDMIRWTTVPIHVNGKLVTVDPRNQTWMIETDDAWIKATKEGAVGIYNQGVLVRFDPGGQWGAGGLIVTKKAIGLNVSRTEILRRTCEVWRRIEPRMRELCRQVAEIDDGRIDENARRRWAVDLLKDGDAFADALVRPIITLVPNRHVSLAALCNNGWRGMKPLSVLDDSYLMPRAEIVQRMGLVDVVSPITLDRLRCQDVAEFEELLASLPAKAKAWSDDVIANGREEEIRNRYVGKGRRAHVGTAVHDMIGAKFEFIPFDVLGDRIVQHCSIVDHKEMDIPLRRVWTALRWALERYAAEIRYGMDGGDRHTDRSADLMAWGSGMHRKVLMKEGHGLAVLPGRSPNMEGWTDGATYVAIEIGHVQAIVTHGPSALDAVWRVMDHELAHDGDSVEAGHDEAFYQRHHDIVLQSARLAGQYKEMFLRKWAQSYTDQTKRGGGKARIREEFLTRLTRERRQRGEDLRHWRDREKDVDRIEIPDVPHALVTAVRENLVSRGLSAPVPTLGEIREAADRYRTSERTHSRRRRPTAGFYEEDGPFDPGPSDDGYHEALEARIAESEAAAEARCMVIVGDIAEAYGRTPDEMWTEMKGVLMPRYERCHEMLEIWRFLEDWLQDTSRSLADGCSHDDLDFVSIVHRLAADRGCTVKEVSLADAYDEWLRLDEIKGRDAELLWQEEFEGDFSRSSTRLRSGMPLGEFDRVARSGKKIVEQRYDWMRSEVEIQEDRRRAESLAEIADDG